MRFHDSWKPVAVGWAVALALATVAGEPSATLALVGEAHAGEGNPGPGLVVNLNTATEADLCALPGIGKKKAKAILEERKARGPFRSVEDLDRVEGIGRRTLARLRPYLTVNPAEAGKPVRVEGTEGGDGGTEAAGGEGVGEAGGGRRRGSGPVLVVNLNTATEADLRTVPGIGKRKAKAILEERKARGPFRSVEDLDRVEGIGRRTLARLRPYLTVNPAEAGKPARVTEGDASADGRGHGSPGLAIHGRVNLNLAGIPELMALPTIGRRTAEAIVEYRKTRGFFHSVDDLRHVKGLGSSDVEQVRPFATVLLDINAADQADFAALFPVALRHLAPAVVAHRERNGPFQSVDDLYKVPGLTAEALGPVAKLLTTQPQD